VKPSLYSEQFGVVSFFSPFPRPGIVSSPFKLPKCSLFPLPLDRSCGFHVLRMERETGIQHFSLQRPRPGRLLPSSSPRPILSPLLHRTRRERCSFDTAAPCVPFPLPESRTASSSFNGTPPVALLCTGTGNFFTLFFLSRTALPF